MMKPIIAKSMNETSQAKSISAKGNIINHFKITPCNKLKLFSICKIEIINVITVGESIGPTESECAKHVSK